MINTAQSISETFRKAGIDMDDDHMIKAMEAIAYSGDSVRRYAEVSRMGQQSQPSTPTRACTNGS